MAVGTDQRRGNRHTGPRTHDGANVCKHLAQAGLDGFGIIGAEVQAPAIHGGMPEIIDGLPLLVV
ncbi:hypothetical protein D3C73_1609400 [compost metagenome]